MCFDIGASMVQKIYKASSQGVWEGIGSTLNVDRKVGRGCVGNAQCDCGAYWSFLKTVHAHCECILVGVIEQSFHRTWHPLNAAALFNRSFSLYPGCLLKKLKPVD